MKSSYNWCLWFVLVLTDAFSLNTIFISQPQPHPRDETDIQTKVQTQGLGIEIRICHEKRSTKAALWGIISWLSRITQNHTHSPKQRFISRWDSLVHSSFPWFPPECPGCWWPMPPASPRCLSIACGPCLSFRHQTTIDRDSILSPPQPAPHKTLIARKLWRTQIAPARMSCKPPQKLLCSPKPTSIVEKNWNIYNYSGQLFHFSRSFWIVLQVKFIMIWKIKMTITCLLWSNYPGIQRNERRRRRPVRHCFEELGLWSLSTNTLDY